MPLLADAIGTIADRLSASRARTRATRTMAEASTQAAAGALAITAGYASTVRTRVRGDARPRGGSPDSHMTRWGVEALRRDGQELLRENALARSLLNRLADMVVGEGYRLSLQGPDADWNRDVERRFHAWAGSTAPDRRGRMCLHQLAHAWLRQVGVDGTALVLRLRDGTLQTIEAQRLRNPPNEAETTTFHGGVEMDRGGRPVAYHIAEWDRSGAYETTGTAARPARDVLALLNPLHLRPNQTLGEPVLGSSVVARLERVDRICEAVGYGAIMAACFGICIKSESPAALASGLSSPNPSGATGPREGERREVEFAPGMVLPLLANESIEQLKPEQPHANLDAHLLHELAMISADCGVPLIHWLFRFDQVNFHSARSAMQTAEVGFGVWRWWVERNIYDRIFAWWLERSIALGEIEPAPGMDRREWVWPPPPVLDPKVEYEAAAFAIREGLLTRGHVLRQLTGGDLEEHFDALAAEKAAMERRGILPSLQPGAKDPNAPAPTTPPPAAPTTNPARAA